MKYGKWCKIMFKRQLRKSLVNIVVVRRSVGDNIKEKSTAYEISEEGERDDCVDCRV